MKTLHGMLIILVLASAGIGPAAAESEVPRQFDIELLIFQNLIKNDAGEVWPVDYSTWFDDATGASAQADGQSPRVTWLPESSYHLAAERNALGRSSQYRPLAYLAWRQSVYDRRRAQALTLPEPDNRGQAYVDGKVRVAVERYLHLYLDLQLHLPRSATQTADGDTELPVIRLTEKRRMRSQEIHYFDNPRFGVIALITPYAPPKPASTPDSPPAPPAQP